MSKAPVSKAWVGLDDPRPVVVAGMVASINGLRSVPSLHISGVPVKDRPWEAVGGEQLDLVGGDCGGACFT